MSMTSFAFLLQVELKACLITCRSINRMVPLSVHLEITLPEPLKMQVLNSRSRLLNRKLHLWFRRWNAFLLAPKRNKDISNLLGASFGMPFLFRPGLSRFRQPIPGEITTRSEERRVGNEYRSKWEHDACEKK